MTKFSSFSTLITLNYLGTSFGLLTFERGFRFSSTMYHYVYVYIVLLFIVFRFGGIPRKAAKLEAKLKA
jgi:hypothetical protein